MKTVDFHEYSVHIGRLPISEGGGFIAVVPDLPGCISDGETEHEALDNVQGAIQDWIECARSMGREVPKPTPMHASSTLAGMLPIHNAD